MQSNFLALVRDLCKLADLEDTVPRPRPESPVAVGLPVDGVGFTLLHAPTRPEALSVFCDLGELPEASGDACLRVMSQLNLLLATSATGSIGLDGNTQRLVYAFALPLRSLTATALLERLTAAATESRRCGEALEALAEIDAERSSTAAVA
jgi:hypothetical protein